MKGVVGYDLTRPSWQRGHPGVITKITLKLIPRA